MRADALRPLFLFDGVSDGDLATLAAAGDEVPFAAGDVLFLQEAPAEYWWVLLEGRVDIVQRAGREENVVATLANPGQWAGGFTAWSDGVTNLATGRGATAGRIFRVPSADLGRWTRALLPLAGHLLNGAFHLRPVEALASQREALVALGTVAAGLAHEINNPAGAAARAVEALREVSDDLLASLVSLARESATAQQFIDLDTLRRGIGERSATTSMSRADLEEQLTTWLEKRDVADAWRIAPALAEAGVDPTWCESVAAVVAGRMTGPGLSWVASTLSTKSLLEELREATTRISALVAAVRSYSQLDRASVQLIDVTDGIESTLVILRHKIPHGVSIVREYAPDLPRIEANPAQLNRVWTNLIDNAIDAMGGAGNLRLRTRTDEDAVVIEVIDDGPGMSPEVQAHAFDPFFTTKDVGKGTGLGLDMSRHIVHEQHRGDITIQSRPGETVLRVRLPVRSQGAQ